MSHLAIAIICIPVGFLLGWIHRSDVASTRVPKTLELYPVVAHRRGKLNGRWWL